jgi:uroporphyrinogen decarboxylase
MLPPFSLASQLIGMETMLMDMVMGGEDLHELLQRVTDFCKLYADRMLEEGVDGILFDNGASTTDLLSLEMAEEFMYKYTKEVYEHVQSNGGYVISHNCALHATYDLEIAMKPDALNFSYGEVDIIKEKHGINCANIHAKSGCSPRYCMKELANSNVCLMGNIESSVLLNESPTIIEQEVKNCIEAAPEKGFILSTGCEIPLDVPADKMEKLWEAIKTHF